MPTLTIERLREAKASAEANHLFYTADKLQQMIDTMTLSSLGLISVEVSKKIMEESIGV